MKLNKVAGNERLILACGEGQVEEWENWEEYVTK